MDAAHEIFQKPFKVEFDSEEIDTPKNYAKYPEGAGLPGKMKAWRVHPDKLAENNVGLVSDGYGFTDTPDCEFISGGVNSKGPGSVALGRQGNWFLWGFCAAPSEMTESGRRAFLNTVVYMKRFSGQKALVTNPTKSRRWAYVYASVLESGLDDGDDELRAYYTQMFDAKILAEAGDVRKLAGVLEANEGHLIWLENEKPASSPASSRPSVPPRRIAIDEDTRAIGVANTDPALLDRCIAMLDKGDKKDLARRVLERYTAETHGTDAAAWRRWFDSNRSRLYFTDTGGYRFRVK